MCLHELLIDFLSVLAGGQPIIMPRSLKLLLLRTSWCFVDRVLYALSGEATGPVPADSVECRVKSVEVRVFNTESILEQDS